MLNPDGVIYGNYRCSLLGVDLNRRWINPSKILHPTIFYTKQLVKMMDIDRSVELFTDIHGHSRKFNVFTYACCFNEFTADAKLNTNIKVFPAILSDWLQAFQFKDCCFSNEKEKEATARMVMFKEFSILNSYTLEASFFGTEPPEEQDLNEETFSATLNPKESLQDIQISPSDIFIHNNRRDSMVPSSPTKDSMLINNSPCKESIFNMSPIKTDDPNDEEIDPL